MWDAETWSHFWIGRNSVKRNKRMNFFNKLNRWFKKFIYGDQTYLHKRVDENPDVISKGIVYLIGDSPQPWAASFLCPCGCGEVVMLSLIPTDSPSWKARLQKNGAISLSPSIWRTRGCRSHFFIHGGKTIWAKS